MKDDCFGKTIYTHTVLDRYRKLRKLGKGYDTQRTNKSTPAGIDLDSTQIRFRSQIFMCSRYLTQFLSLFSYVGLLIFM